MRRAVTAVYFLVLYSFLAFSGFGYFEGLLFGGPRPKLPYYHSATSYNGFGSIIGLGGDVDLAISDSRIKEIVPKQYLQRYNKWKSELLATEYGRGLWSGYDADPRFQLKIVVIDERGFGAGTDDFKWSEDGTLIAATIYLGKDLDKGIPDPVYYPVMNSLAGPKVDSNVSGNILASAKFAHELGHVVQTAETNGLIFQRQNKLIANYYRIFLKNGYDSSDPRLVELVNELGARPIEIWESREYWSEVSAMRFLVERLEKDETYCHILRRIRLNVGNFAKAYRTRFETLNDSLAVSGCRE